MKIRFKGFQSKKLTARLKACFQKLVEKFDETVEQDCEPTITVEWNPRMRTRAGVASYKGNRIELNSRLLTENPSELLPTFIHEVAHIFTHIKFPKAVGSHGYQWKYVMRTLGTPIEECHTMEVKHLKHNRRKWVATCNCSTSHTVGVRRRNKALKGTVYKCTRCRSKLTFGEEIIEGGVK